MCLREAATAGCTGASCRLLLCSSWSCMTPKTVSVSLLHDSKSQVLTVCCEQCEKLQFCRTM
jgi:hypothetical protein